MELLDGLFSLFESRSGRANRKPSPYRWEWAILAGLLGAVAGGFVGFQLGPQHEGDWSGGLGGMIDGAWIGLLFGVTPAIDV